MPLIGVWNKAEDIDFSMLPQQFVLKCNHDSGSVIVCKNKDAEDKNAIVEKLKTAKRPVLLLGTGVRLADCRDDVLRFAETARIPIVTAWNAHDLIWDDHELYCGRPGTVGSAAFRGS